MQEDFNSEIQQRNQAYIIGMHVLGYRIEGAKVAGDPSLRKTHNRWIIWKGVDPVVTINIPIGDGFTILDAKVRRRAKRRALRWFLDFWESHIAGVGLVPTVVSEDRVYDYGEGVVVEKHNIENQQR